MNINKIAKIMVKKYGLNDPLEIALAKGIILLEEDLKGVLSYSHTYKRQSFIHLNKDSSLKVKRVLCACELGHLILNPKEDIHLIDDVSLRAKNDFEKYAKLFAAHLLIPDKILKEHEKESPEAISKSLNLPLDIVLLKLNS